MAKQLKIKYMDNEYTLEFTRKTVADMERSGFVADEILTKPMTTLPALFQGSFLAHHRKTKPAVIDNIFAQLGNKEDLIGKLAEMYNEPLVELLDEPEEAQEKLDWTVNW